MATTTAGANRQNLRHEALLYATDDDYRRGVGSFVHDGLNAGDPVFVAVPQRQGDLVRAAIDGLADAVRYTDMSTLGRNPACIIPAIRAFFDEHPRQSVRFVGEPIWAGRSEAEIAEATRHEALINTAFGHRVGTVLCPYDVSALDPSVIADAARTHPQMIDGDSCRPSDDYTDPLTLCDARSWPLPPPPADAEIVAFAHGQLDEMRLFVRRRGTAWGLPTARISDLVLAVNELTTNTLLHSGGPGVLQAWREPGSMVCEVYDSGHIADPLAGRHIPDTDSPHHRGLWLVNRLCDLVQLRSDPSGTTVRVHVSIEKADTTTP